MIQTICYVSTSEDGRIGATTPYEEYAEGMEEFEFPDDFDFIIQNEYRIVDGELIHDPLPPDPSVQISKLKQKLKETDYVVGKIAESMVTGISLDEGDAERYAEIISQRQEWRDEINRLEEE